MAYPRLPHLPVILLLEGKNTLFQLSLVDFSANARLFSVIGGELPLAASSIYKSPGPNWAGTLLALLEVGLIPIALAVCKWGGILRARSRLV